MDRQKINQKFKTGTELGPQPAMRQTETLKKREKRRVNLSVDTGKARVKC